MARTLKTKRQEQDSFACLPKIHDEVHEFVEDLVRYVFQFLNTEDPPRVCYRLSGFTNSIGKAVLKLMRRLDNHNFLNQLQRFISSCGSIPRPRNVKVMEKITAFLYDSADPINVSPPQPYFVLLVIACKLCAGFAQAQQQDCVHATRETLKIILREQGADFCTFCDVDRLAVKVMNPEMFYLLNFDASISAI